VRNYIRNFVPHLIFVVIFVFASGATRGIAADKLPEGLLLQTTAEETTYTSPWLKVAFSRSDPKMTFLSVDGLGNGSHSRNLLKSPVGGGSAAAAANALLVAGATKCTAAIGGNVVRYSDIAVSGV
jgi:hypothetical protein